MSTLSHIMIKSDGCVNLGRRAGGHAGPVYHARMFSIKHTYRVRHLPGCLGWVDLDLGSSPGWWAATVAIYCPSRMVEHPKSKSTKPRYPGRWDSV